MARKILLADDSVTAQNMGRKILTDAGYDVIAVNNGSAALKKIAEHKPDLIVLDVYMPGYSGLEVCQRIKENRETARIPVLLTVGKLEPFKPEEARRARADAFVVKPFEASELLTALTKLEDKIVAQPDAYKPGRLAKALAAIEEPGPPSGEKFGDADQGWKSRLRFPSRKNKTPEPSEAPDTATVGGKNFRDVSPPESPSIERFGREPSKSERVSPFSEPSHVEGFIPSGLPSDITPEEIAAISAAAARLSGPKPETVVPEETAAQDSRQSAEPTPAISEAAAATPAPPASEITHEATTPAIESVQPDSPQEAKAEGPADSGVLVAPKSEATGEASLSAEPRALASSDRDEDAAPITFASAPGLEVERPSESVSRESAPVVESRTEPANEPPAVVAAAEKVSAQTAPAETPAIASSSFETPEAAQTQIEASQPEPEKIETPPQVEATASVVETPTLDEPRAEPLVEQEQPVTTEFASDVVIPAAALPEDSRSAEVGTPSVAASANIEETAISLPAPPVETAPIVSELPVAAARAHDDVMAALQSLIPPPSPEAAAISVLAAHESSPNEATELTYIGTSSRTRWIAEEASLSAEESSLSLENEMEKAYAAFAASEAARLLASSVLETFPGTQPTVPPSTSITTQSGMSSDTPEAATETMIAGATEFAAVSREVTAEPVPTHSLASAAAVGESGIPSVSVPHLAGEENSKPATDIFAEEHRYQAPEIPDSAVTTMISPAEPAPVSDQDSIAGGTDEMDRKNSESLGFKMIRQSPAAAQKSNPKPEPSKENFEEPSAPEPAAMAAAAAAERAPSAATSIAATDPKAIASIVDSVLAELRPKIVEEIAKKLAGDGKKE